MPQHHATAERRLLDLIDRIRHAARTVDLGDVAGEECDGSGLEDVLAEVPELRGVLAERMRGLGLEA
jgi:hypothetical protein